MTVKNYSIENIKAFRNEANIQIKPITVFVGKNSSGKSSLLRFPVVLSQSISSDAETPIVLFGKNIDYGNYEDVVFDHNKKGSMHFSVSYECDPSRFYENYSKEAIYGKAIGKTVDVCFDVSVIKYSRRMIVDACEIQINGRKCLEVERNSREIYKVHIIDYLDENKRIELPSEKVAFSKFIPWFGTEELADSIIRVINQNKGLETGQIELIKRKIRKNSYECTVEEKESFGKNYEDVTNVFEWFKLIDMYSRIVMSARIQAAQEAESTYYIGPFRENPNRVYRDVEHRVDAVGTRGEDVSTMLRNDYFHGKKVINGVSEWLNKSMQYGVSLKEIGGGLYSIVVKKRDGKKDNLIDVGYGISQVLPIVAQLMSIRDDGAARRYYPYSAMNISTFIIEQPELHLHPEAQAELANLFVNSVVSNSESKRLNVMIETHSEHLIRRLQALVASDKYIITNEDVAIYYVDKNENNEAYIQEMKLLPNGQFEKDWPSGFFDKGYQLALELVRGVE